MIVGGCDGGRLQLYSVAKLLSGEEGLVVSKEKHTGPVRTLDFNPFQVFILIIIVLMEVLNYFNIDRYIVWVVGISEMYYVHQAYLYISV